MVMVWLKLRNNISFADIMECPVVWREGGGEMVRARFDQILLGRKQREGWRRANFTNAIRKYHILENPAMRLEGKKEQLRAE